MTVWLGGPAEAAGRAGEIFLSACARAGIAGVAEPLEPAAGICFVMRAGSARAEDAGAGCDVLVATDEATLGWAGAARRLVLYDAARTSQPQRLLPGAAALDLPGLSPAAAVGALTWLAGLDAETLTAAWGRRLRGQTTESAALSVQAARAAYEAASSGLGATPFELRPGAERLLLLSGAQALGWGALAAGCTCLAVPDFGRDRGPAAWMRSLAARVWHASHPAVDESSAVGLAAGAALAGARALADLSAGSLAAAGEMLRFCAETGLPAVILAPVDGWRWPGGLPVAELRATGAAEAFLMAAEAFNLAERHGVPVVVRADPSLLGRWESLPGLPATVPIARGSWASSPDSEAETRVVPGQDGTMRVVTGLPADVLARRRAALEEEACPACPSPNASGLFPVPAAATLEERGPLAPTAFLPEGAGEPRCASAQALRLCARAWSEQGLQPKDILVVAGGACCLAEPLFPRTYGVRTPAGCALAVAAGAKLANPALAVAVMDDGAAIFSRSLAQVLVTARINSDLLVLFWTRGGESPVDLLGLARQAGATFLARLPSDDEAGAGVIDQALSHKGFSLVEFPCAQAGGVAQDPGIIHEQAGQPSFEETEPCLAAQGAPVGMALDLRARLCVRLAEELG